MCWPQAVQSFIDQKQDLELSSDVNWKPVQLVPLVSTCTPQTLAKKGPLSTQLYKQRHPSAAIVPDHLVDSMPAAVCVNSLSVDIQCSCAHWKEELTITCKCSSGTTEPDPIPIFRVTVQDSALERPGLVMFGIRAVASIQTNPNLTSLIWARLFQA